MFDGDKNEELKNELNETVGSGEMGGSDETGGEKAAADNIANGVDTSVLNSAEDKVFGGAATSEESVSGEETKTSERIVLGGAATGENIERPEQKFYYQRDKNFIKKSNAKNALAFALLGLLLGPFLGVGIFFSVAALAAAMRVNAKSTTKKWAIIVSIVGVILNAAFIAALVVALIVYGFYLPPVEGV